MALSAELAAALATTPALLEEAKGLDAKAEKLTPDVEKLLPDLVKLPELQAQAAALTKVIGATQAKSAEDLIKDFGNLKTINLDLKGQVETLKKGTGGAGGAVDVTKDPQFLALQEKIENLTKESTERIAALENESKTSKESAASSLAEKRETDLRAAVIAAAAKFKVKNAEDEFILLKAKGQIGYTEKDGKYTPFFLKLNDKGEKVALTSADDLLKHIADTDKSKVDPSGKGGVGAQHTGDGGASGDGPKTAAEARAAYLQR